MDWAHSEGAFHNHITAFLEKYKHYFPSFSVSKRDYLTGSTRKILVVELLFHPVFISSFFCRVMKIGNSLLQWIIHVFSLLNIILVVILSFMQQGREAGILKSNQ